MGLAYSLGAGLTPDATCRFSREEGTGSRRDFFVGCPNALAASIACFVTDRWFTPHFSVVARFCIDAWIDDVACPIVCQPIWPACWLDTSDRSSSSATRAVQDVWDVYRVELGEVPGDVVLALRDAVSRSAVDDFWTIWSRSAEEGLFRAYSGAGGLIEACSAAFLGRGLPRNRSRRLGGRSLGGRGSGRLYRASRGDEVDVHCAQYADNSSLAPVVLFRRRLKSVADVLKGIRSGGVLLSLGGMLFWVTGRLYVVMVRVVLSPPLIPGISGILPICIVSTSGVFDSLGLLNDFLKQVVVSRRDVGIRKWSMWLREDLSSRPYVWLRPDFVPTSPFLIVKDPQTESS